MSDEKDDAHASAKKGPRPAPEKEARFSLPDLPEDRELSALLERWTAPEPSESLDLRVLASYRREIRPPSLWVRLKRGLRSGKAPDVAAGGTASRRWAFVSAVSVLMAVVVFSVRPRAASAARVLESARAAEHEALSSPGLVSHRVLTIEARRQPDQALISRARVEVWRKGPSGQKTRRLYDQSGTLIAGEWTAPDGSRTLYRRGQPSAHESAAPSAMSFDDAWRWEPSAQDFMRLARGVEGTSVRDDGESFVLSYRPTPAGGRATILVEARLTVRKQGWRAVEQSLVVREAEEVREYRTVEGRFDRVPEATAAARFEPEPELTGAPPKPAPLPRLPAPARPALNTLILEQLELQAWYRLHQADVCLGEAGSVTRTAEGLQIRAAVDSEARRRLLQEGLRALAERPGVEVAVSSRTEEAGALGATTAAEGKSDPPLATSPAYQRVKTHLLAQIADRHKVSDEQLEHAVRQLAVWTLERSAHRVTEARAIEHLLSRWPPHAVRALGLDSQATWHVMLAQHAREIEQQSELLRLQLQPVFFPAAAVDSDPGSTIASASDLAAVVARLVEQVGREDQSLRAAFLSAEPTGQLAELGPSFAGTVQLARRLSSPQAMGK